MNPGSADGMSLLEYHVLLALAGAPLHGYAIKGVVAEESSGTLTPRAGSLYRVIARLMTAGYVVDAEPKGAREPHPGLERKYYALTPSGRAALAAEARRLKQAAAMAEKRLGILRSRS
jgi:DNA-binding PadR family transcriptional regulator